VLDGGLRAGGRGATQAQGGVERVVVIAGQGSEGRRALHHTLLPVGELTAGCLIDLAVVGDADVAPSHAAAP
jgi:hypothetical protein